MYSGDSTEFNELYNPEIGLALAQIFSQKTLDDRMPLVAELMGWEFDPDAWEFSKLLENGNTVHFNTSISPIPASDLQEGDEEIFLDMVTKQIMICLKGVEEDALKKHLGESE